jgi:hypothetical protein
MAYRTNHIIIILSEVKVMLSLYLIKYHAKKTHDGVEVQFYTLISATALGYGLGDRGSRVRFPAGVGNFSLHHRVQNGSGAHPASYTMGTRGSFPGGKAAGA